MKSFSQPIVQLPVARCFLSGLEQCVRDPWPKSSVMSKHTMPGGPEIPFLVELFSGHSSNIIARKVLILKVIFQTQKVKGLFRTH